MGTGGRKGRRARVPELLAPAGSMEALRAAVAAGADAVYLGGKRFSARQFAPNFPAEELAEAVAYAHLHGVRVYVTVNTLVREGEIPAALSFLHEVYRMGADGAIIQDTGLLSLARRAFPGLSLHASTQATIATPEGVAWAGRSGYARVILPRELTLGELDAILAVPKGERPEVEIFVHGALCYSYSGQCLLSSLAGGRSGNRGMCAQPCRKPYRLVELPGCDVPAGRRPPYIPPHGKYLLSTRDLCIHPRLDRVVSRDIAALKIEGRMRSPTYVAVVVRAYRRALDAIAWGQDHVRPGDMEAMALAFSRGFSEGYLFGDTSPMGREASGNRGLFVGTVRSVREGEGILVEPETQITLSAGDGILVTSPGGEVRGGLSLKEQGIPRGRHLLVRAAVAGTRAGDLLFLTRSRTCEEMARSIVGEEKINRPVPVNLTLHVRAGTPVTWSASFTHPKRGKMEVGGESAEIPAAARSRPLSPKTIRTQIGKTSKSPFIFREVRVEGGGGGFLPLSSLNRVRREILERLSREWTRAFSPPPADLKRAESVVDAIVKEAQGGVRGTGTSGIHESSRGKSRPLLCAHCATLDEIAGACEAGCDTIRFEPTTREWHRDKIRREILKAVAACSDAGADISWMWPHVAPSSFVGDALEILPGLSEEGLGCVTVGETGLAEAIKARVPGVRVFGGQGLNIFNSWAALFLHPSIDGFTLSPELPCTDIPRVITRATALSPGISFEVICQGNIEVMVSRNRLLSDIFGRQPPGCWGIEDEAGRVFPVYEDGLGRTRVLNAVETTLIDYVPFLLTSGVGSLAVDARCRGRAYVREVISAYRQALDLTLSGRADQTALARLKERIRRVARGGLTAGHFHRPEI